MYLYIVFGVWNSNNIIDSCMFIHFTQLKSAFFYKKVILCKITRLLKLRSFTKCYLKKLPCIDNWLSILYCERLYFSHRFKTDSYFEILILYDAYHDDTITNIPHNVSNGFKEPPLLFFLGSETRWINHKQEFLI